MMLRPNRFVRRGTVVPTLALFIMGLLGMIALAVDIGLIAIARTEAQSAADIAALAGARMLNGDPTSSYNIATSVSTAKAAATNNTILNQAVSTSQVSVRTGVYRYNSGIQRFEPDWSAFTASPSGTPSGGGAWTASEATLNANSPTYFARVFGINSFDVTAYAVAVHRPRDVALILDFSGSMRFSSTTHWPDSGNVSGSLNPDSVWPKFGHWSRYVGMATTGANPMQRTIDYTMSSGENLAPNNLTTTTDNGPPVIGSAGDTSKQYFLHRNAGGSLVSAWNYPQGNSYDPNYSPVAQPAPDSFQDDTAAGYVGDKFPRKNVLFTGTDWATTAQDYLTGSNTTLTTTHSRSSANGPGGMPFDAIEGTNNGYGRDFKGYSMGPGYYGKTFWMWPPDPRFTAGADPTSVHASDPKLDSSGRFICDWRQRFFKFGSGHARAGQRCDDNSALFDTSGYLLQATSTSYAVDYTAVIKWIKSGPQVFPPNLRAGRVLYYDSIPDTIPATGGTADQVFWRRYIDAIIGTEANRGQRQFYGRESNTWLTTTKITARSSLLSGGNRASATNPAPFMHYNDNPKRPRAHFWFGPLTMLMFITESNQDADNMWPGTCSEAQTWQLKAGIQSAIDDVRRNHPNDWLALMYFSNLSGYNTPRVKLGQDYNRMKNALWFPNSLLDQLGNATAELRPYDTNFTYNGAGNIPNASGGTCPDMGLKLAYNEFSMASGYNGRRGAAKLVILETDGVPNHTCGGSLNANGAYYSTYGTVAQIGSTTSLGNGNSTVIAQALATVTQITNLDNSTGKGYSSSRQPARVHAIAFGDLFETSTSLKSTALTFLTNVQVNGKTQPVGSTTLEDYKIIIGNYNTRIDKLRQAFERIMQSGVQVSLIR